MFHKLEQLNKLRSDLKIQVRVTRMWPSVGNNGKLTGFNMILLDQEDYHVHAFVHSEIWNDLQNHVFEGNIYDFKNFVTQNATGTFRPVNTNMSIVLTNLTIVTPVLLEVGTIPGYKFDILMLKGLLHTSML